MIFRFSGEYLALPAVASKDFSLRHWFSKYGIELTFKRIYHVPFVLVHITRHGSWKCLRFDSQWVGNVIRLFPTVFFYFPPEHMSPNPNYKQDYAKTIYV